jgi:predicted nucleic acid-binding Zn ribbon protein
MAETIPQHRHCFVCGRTHTEDGRFCSEKCKDEKRGELKKKKRQLWIIEILAVAMMVAAIIFMM